jgi:YHS domain-containing protein
MSQFLFILAVSFFLRSTSASPASLERLNANGVALCEDRDSKDDGACYDPVGFFVDGKAEKVGDAGKKFRHRLGQATYVFINEKNLDIFKANPAKYLPQYGGWCAYAVAKNKDKVDIDPKSFHIQDGRLLLFYDSFLAHTRKTWLNDKCDTYFTFYAYLLPLFYFRLYFLSSPEPKNLSTSLKL